MLQFTILNKTTSICTHKYLLNPLLLCKTVNKVAMMLAQTNLTEISGRVKDEYLTKAVECDNLGNYIN